MTQRPIQDLSKLPPPTLVEDEEGMERLLDSLEGEREIAFDTEADSFFHYREKVCLIQVTAGGEDWLVDPLCGLDLSGLGEVLANPEQTVVFHDGEYDIAILKRDYGFEFAGLYDTRVAAAALGSDSPGLASVLLNRFGIQLDKSMQRSDWSRRPLSREQITYARLDTRYLIPLMHEQIGELEARERAVILEGECRRLEALEPPDRTFQPDDFARIKGVRDLNPDERRALRELFVMREELAQERDLPPFKVLSNQVLLDLARERPRNREELFSIPKLPIRQLKRIERRALAALDEAHELGPIERLPRLPSRDGTGELDEPQQELHDRLRNWRRDVANREELDSSLVLNRHVLLRLAKEAPADDAALERVDGLQPWQRQLFAAQLLEVVRTFQADLAAGRIEFPRRRKRRS